MLKFTKNKTEDTDNINITEESKSITNTESSNNIKIKEDLLDNLGDLDDLDDLDNSEKSESSVASNNTELTEDEKQKINIGDTIEEIKNKITKKDKIDKFSDSESTKLYVLTDRYSDRVLSYFRDKGLKVSKMSNRIADIRKELLLAQVINKSSCYRLVIVETGLGKFTGVGARKELVDLLGIVNDSLHISIFYTESLIKSDTELKYNDAFLRIDWNKYISTAATVATLLKFGETYEYQNKIQEIENYSDALNKKRTNLSNFMNQAYTRTDKKPGLNMPNIEDRGITSLDKLLSDLQSDKYQLIKTFKVKY